MSFSLTYADYVQSHPEAQGGSEGGQGTFSGLSEDQWNALSPEAKWNNVGGGIALSSADPRYADIATRLGIDPKSTSPDDTLLISPGKGPIDPSLVVDPSKMIDLGDGLSATFHANLSPKAEFAGGGLSDNFWALAPLMIVGAGFAGAAMGVTGADGAIAGASPALESGGIITSGDIAAGTSAGMGATSTAGAAATGTTGSIVGNAGDPGYAGSFDAGGTPGAAEAPGSTFDPYGAAPPEAPPPPAPAAQPAPVTDVSTPAPGTSAQPAPVTDVSTPAPSGNGIIDGARNTVNGVSDWYSHLSPASRLILGQFIGAGFRGAMGAAQQRAAHQAQTEAEDRARQDTIRRGAVPLLPPNTFTQKPPGG